MITSPILRLKLTDLPLFLVSVLLHQSAHATSDPELQGCKTDVCQLNSGETLSVQCKVPIENRNTTITLGSRLLSTEDEFLGSLHYYSSVLQANYTMHLENLTCTTITADGLQRTTTKVVEVKFNPIIKEAICICPKVKSLSEDYFEYKVTFSGFANPAPASDSIQFKFDSDTGNVTQICKDCDKESDPTCFFLQYLVRDIKKKDFEDGAEALINIGGTNMSVSCPPIPINHADVDNVKYDKSSGVRLEAMSSWTPMIIVAMLSVVLCSLP